VGGLPVDAHPLDDGDEGPSERAGILARVELAALLAALLTVSALPAPAGGLGR